MGAFQTNILKISDREGGNYIFFPKGQKIVLKGQTFLGMGYYSVYKL